MSLPQIAVAFHTPSWSCGRRGRLRRSSRRSSMRSARPQPAMSQGEPPPGSSGAGTLVFTGSDIGVGERNSATSPGSVDTGGGAHTKVTPTGAVRRASPARSEPEASEGLTWPARSEPEASEGLTWALQARLVPLADDLLH